MKKVKTNSNLTWKAIAHSLDVSGGMLFFYLNEKSKISKENYERLRKIGNIKPKSLSYIIIRNKTQRIKIPQQMNEELAELLGLLGWGWTCF